MPLLCPGVSSHGKKIPLDDFSVNFSQNLTPAIGELHIAWTFESVVTQTGRIKTNLASRGETESLLRTRLVFQFGHKRSSDFALKRILGRTKPHGRLLFKTESDPTPDLDKTTSPPGNNSGTIPDSGTHPARAFMVEARGRAKAPHGRSRFTEKRWTCQAPLQAESPKKNKAAKGGPRLAKVRESVKNLTERFIHKLVYEIQKRPGTRVDGRAS